MFHLNKYRASLISESLRRAEVEQVLDDYRIMLVSVLSVILDRYERDPDYHFIDTKLSLINGKDFDEDDPIRGKQAIYSWIQGRGLEALAGHEMWLRRDERIDEQVRTELGRRVRVVLAEVLRQMEHLREINGGRLFFIMNPEGKALRITGEGQVVTQELTAEAPSNYSDIFYVKGLAAAAHVLGLKDKLAEACERFEEIRKDIQAGRFASDQQQLDPRNVAAKHVEGRYSHGAYMIGVGAAARFLQCTGEAAFQEAGLEFLDHILKYHINLAPDNERAKRYEMWEFVDKDGKPYVAEDGVLLSDPGHACEFVGLALGFIRTCETTGTLTEAQKGKIKEYKRIFPGVLRQNFANGISPRGLGIRKGIDLISRRPVNPDMPWWSLPETMRAALAARQVVSAEERPAFEKIAAKCSNIFVSHYIKPDLNLMAVQTLNRDGQPVNVIPATPDADPGYHTGLSIIDCLELWRG